MEQSTLHIKAPHEIHIGAKVMAAKRRISMNQYIVDLIESDMTKNDMPPVRVEKSLEALGKASPKQKKTIEKAIDVVEELTKIPGVIKASEAPEKCPGDHPIRMNCGREGCPYA